jgi:hypothetical protein
MDPRDLPAFSYRVPYWWALFSVLGAALTAGSVFIALTPPTLVDGLFCVSCISLFLQQMGWSQFHGIRCRYGTLEFSAIFRQVTCGAEDVEAVRAGGWIRTSGRLTRGHRFVHFTLRDGRRVRMMSGKGFRDFTEALAWINPDMTIDPSVLVGVYESASGKSGFTTEQASPQPRESWKTS